MPFIIYGKDTGSILCTKKMRPMNLPEGYSFILAPLQVDLSANRVEHGRIVPRGLQARVKAERQAKWFEFRQKRRAYFEAIKHKESRFYPLTEAERTVLDAQMAESRDLPQTYDDPVAAIARLDQIWSEDDVE